MPKYLVTLTSDEFVDVKHFIDWLDRHELSVPELHGKDLFLTKATKAVKKGDFIVWMYKRSRGKDVFLAGMAGVQSATHGLFFGLPGHDGKRVTYHGVVKIDPRTKSVKKVKIPQDLFDNTFKDTCKLPKNKKLTLEQMARSGSYISEKEFKKLKGMLK
jgi:ABC-type iron transport system FetAB ATPase subunit